MASLLNSVITGKLAAKVFLADRDRRWHKETLLHLNRVVQPHHGQAVMYIMYM